MPALSDFHPMPRRGLPPWLRKYRRKSGVYAIREPGGKVLYVGESHSGRLYDTVRRHFSKWTGPTAGPTYARSKVELMVIPTTADAAVEAQNKLIRALRPRDNVAEKPGLISWIVEEIFQPF